MFERGDLAFIKLVGDIFTDTLHGTYDGLAEVIKEPNKYDTVEVQILNGTIYHGMHCSIHATHIHKLNNE
jgi:hypothetical protein